jgi:hypothetical protein
MMTEKKSKTGMKPILMIDELPETFGSSSYRNMKKQENKITDEEKILLTLIANVIVEIILREEI